MQIHHPSTRKSSGFTYLGLLFSIAILGTVLAATGIVWHQVRQREKEKELLFIGNQFRHAIGAYYQQTPGPVKRYPQQLENLLLDSRQPNIQRYLRKIYVDPMTGKAEWGIVESPTGGVMGIRSLSQDEPLKSGNFKSDDQSLEGKSKYSEWIFIYLPPAIPANSFPALPKQ